MQTPLHGEVSVQEVSRGLPSPKFIYTVGVEGITTFLLRFYRVFHIFSTEGKAGLHLKSQTFKTCTPERETISSHKLNVCLKLPFPESQGFGALHALVGPRLSASLVGRQTTQTFVMTSKQTLMNFGARLGLAFMDCKIIWLLLPAPTCQ